jgi:hypothetical protein
MPGSEVDFGWEDSPTFIHLGYTFHERGLDAPRRDSKIYTIAVVSALKELVGYGDYGICN